MQVHALVIRARKSARLTQAQLASRVGTTQPAIARLEKPGTNPTIRTLEAVFAATGQRLNLSLEREGASMDESLIRQHLELTPHQRIAGMERMYNDARVISRAGATSRGELA